MPRVPGQIQRKRRSKKDEEEAEQTAAVVTLVEQIVPPMYAARPDMAEKYLRKAQSEGVKGPFTIRHGAPSIDRGAFAAPDPAQPAALGTHSRQGRNCQAAPGLTPTATHSLFSATSRIGYGGSAAGLGSRRN